MPVVDQICSDRQEAGVVVFARYPQMNCVKTRLQPELGASGCLALYQAMLLDSLDRYRMVPARRYLYMTGCRQVEAIDYLRANCMAEGFAVRMQSGGDLGERMWAAYQQVGQDVSNLLFLGTDTPSFPLSRVRRALSALCSHDVVVAPAYDGGYCMLGVSQAVPELFHGIPWGSSRVFEYSVSRLEGLRCRVFDPWYDVDRVEDLNQLAGDLRSDFEGYPKRTGEFLRSRGLLD